jgi:hypothetical protein
LNTMKIIIDKNTEKLSFNFDEIDWDFFPKTFPNLKQIIIKDSEVNGLEFFPYNMPKLKFIGFHDCQIVSFKGFPKIPNQNELSLQLADSYFNFESWEPWMTKVRKIRFYKCSQTSLNGIPQSFPNLEELIFQRCTLNSLKNFPKMVPMLKMISIERCGISSFGGIAQNMPSLEEINISGNAITTLQFLPSELPNLIAFHMIYDQLERIYPESFPEMPKLGWLNIHDNQLTTPFGVPSKEINLSIGGNPVRNLCGISKFQLKKVLRTILKEKETDLSSKAIKFIQEEKFEDLMQYYLVPSHELASRLKKGEKLIDEEYERLKHEGGKMELEILQTSDLPVNHPIIKAITNRLTNRK